MQLASVPPSPTDGEANWVQTQGVLARLLPRDRSGRERIAVDDGRGPIIFTRHLHVWRSSDGKKAPGEMQSMLVEAHSAAGGAK
jgi:hypothetical protein